MKMKTSVEDIKKELEELAIHYDVELDMVLDDLIFGNKIKGMYRSWSLADCYDMKKFYGLIQSGKYKIAYNKLDYLWKESCLVPTKLVDKLFHLYDYKY